MSLNQPEHEPDVTNDPERSRYVVRVGGETVGFAAYRLEGNRITFTHTEVDSSSEGHGVGSVLVREALDDARARNLAVTPECAFVASFIDEHPEYSDLVS